MRRIPPHVAARNRAASEADWNAQYYRPGTERPAKLCVCEHELDDHFFGRQCEKPGCPCRRFRERVQ
jgi:hypothetical protein